MGAKTWMLVYAERDARAALAAVGSGAGVLDRERTVRFVGGLFSGETLKPLEDGELGFMSPPDGEVVAGCFPGVSVVAAKEFAIDRPSTLDARFIRAAGAGAGSGAGVGVVTLHAMHSVVDWFAYARWEGGRLVRSLSLSPDSGVMEDIGERLAFEEPYWAGEHPAAEPGEEYPFPFHPLELGEAALGALFGYQLEGSRWGSVVEPESVGLMRFARVRSRSWWRFWG